MSHPKRRCPILPFGFTLLMGMGGVCLCAHAATVVWDGGGANDNWQTNNNWNPNGAPVAGDTLQFAGTTRLTPNNNFTAGTSFSGIAFNNGAGAFTLGGNSIVLTGNVANNDGTLQTINIAMSMAATRTFSTTTGDLTVGGVLSGAGGLTKNGNGVLTLSGANTYTGTTTVNGGGVFTFGSTLRLAGGSAISDTGAVNLTGTPFGGFTTLDLNNTSETIGSLAGANLLGSSVTLGTATLTTGGNNTSTTYAGVISGSGGLTKAGTGTMTLSGVNIYTGATTINAGTLQLSGGLAVWDTSAVTLANTSGAILDLNGTSETIGSLAGGGGTGGNVTLGAATLTTGGNNTSTTYAGVISGSGGLTKAGTGTLTVSGTNTYTGSTQVNAGTLSVTGSLSTGTVTVASGATLAGTGTLNGNTTIQSGGVIAPGTSGIGSISLGSGADFTMTTGGHYNAQLGPLETSDLVATVDALVLQSGWTLSLFDSGGIDSAVKADEFTLFTFTGSLTIGGSTASGTGTLVNGVDYVLDLSNLSAAHQEAANLAQLRYDVSGGRVYLTQIPLPDSFWIGLTGLSALLGIRAYRRNLSLAA